MLKFSFIAILAFLTAVSCQRVEEPLVGNDLPRVVVTTSIIGDIVSNIGANDIRLDVLIPAGSDPHTVIFRPADMALAARANLLFVNGAGLEGNLGRLIDSVRDRNRMIALSDAMPGQEEICDHEHDAHDHHHHGHHHHDHDHHHHHGAVDPHFWMDPHNVMIWADTIAQALSELQPENQMVFEQRAAAYQESLRELDAWITQRAEQVPQERRKLVTDHKMMGHFASRYDFHQAGVIIPSFDTSSQPAARTLAQLVDQIAAHEVPAIFVGESSNHAVARQLARDAGVELVVLPLESLTDADGPAPDYLSYMRHNIGTIIQYLSGLN